MYTFLLVILILISLVLIAAVLLQAGKGGGLAASFGGASSSSDAFMGTRQAGNLLTKVSWYGGGLFLFLAFLAFQPHRPLMTHVVGDLAAHEPFADAVEGAGAEFVVRRGNRQGGGISSPRAESSQPAQQDEEAALQAIADKGG